MLRREFLAGLCCLPILSKFTNKKEPPLFWLDHYVRIKYGIKCHIYQVTKINKLQSPSSITHYYHYIPPGKFEYGYYVPLCVKPNELEKSIVDTYYSSGKQTVWSCYSPKLNLYGVYTYG